MGMNPVQAAELITHYALLLSACLKTKMARENSAFHVISYKFPWHQDAFHPPISLPSVSLMRLSPPATLQISHPGFSTSPHSFLKYLHPLKTLPFPSPRDQKLHLINCGTVYILGLFLTTLDT